MKTVTIIKKLSYKGSEIEYTLSIKDQKNIALRLDGTTIKVSAPPNVNEWDINNLIYKNMPKISKIINYLDKHKVIDLVNGTVNIFGEKKTLISYQDSIPEEKLKDIYYIKEYETNEDTISKFYKKLSIDFEQTIEKKIRNIGLQMGLEFKNFTLKNMKGKWGVCYPEKSKIVLNVKLVHYPIQALEYVIVHELTHLVHKNHSKDFWHAIHRVMPDYKERAQILKIAL